MIFTALFLKLKIIPIFVVVGLFLINVQSRAFSVNAPPASIFKFFLFCLKNMLDFRTLILNLKKQYLFLHFRKEEDAKMYEYCLQPFNRECPY